MDLLPKPKQLWYENGTFTLSHEGRIVITCPRSGMVTLCARMIAEEAETFTGLRLEYLCGIPREGDVALAISPELPEEGYRLCITSRQVTLTGGSALGLLHGVQTLRQVIRQSAWELPALTVADAPQFPVRGFYHDVSRGRTPTLEYLKHLADTLCFYKLNQLQLYVEHTYLFRDLSEVWRAGTPLTAGEILELDDYCALRGIELVPSLACFGHLFELLRTKTYAGLCELPESLGMPSTMPNRMRYHTLNAADPRSLELVGKMIREFIPLFRSRKFNICADEPFDLGKGRSRERVEALGERACYMEFLRSLCGILTEQGKQPMFWGDCIVHYPDAVGELPQGTICLNWGYSPLETEENTRRMAEAGAVQYVCPGVCGWNEWMPKLRDSYENISRMAQYGVRWGAVGLLNTNWGDFGHINDPRFSLPGLVYGAQFGWSSEKMSFEELNGAISRLCYQDRSGQAVSCLARIQSCVVYPWFRLVHYKEWKCGTQPELTEETSLKAVDASRVDAADRELEAICGDIRRCCAQMDTSARAMTARWQTAVGGCRLWNRVGRAISQDRKDPALADALENWFRQYGQMWRETSQESELWRVREMVNWYADELRA